MAEPMPTSQKWASSLPQVFDTPLAAFAWQTGAGRDRHVVLVLDNAGWHGPKGLAVPDGITLVFLPPCRPATFRCGWTSGKGFRQQWRRSVSRLRGQPGNKVSR
jgi:hypothetical protein